MANENDMTGTSLPNPEGSSASHDALNPVSVPAAVVSSLKSPSSVPVASHRRSVVPPPTEAEFRARSNTSIGSKATDSKREPNTASRWVTDASVPDPIRDDRASDKRADSPPDGKKQAVPIAVGGDVTPSRWRSDSRLQSSFVSTILHTIVLIVLTLLTYKVTQRNQAVISLQGRQGDTDVSVTFEALPTSASDVDHQATLSDNPVQVNLSAVDTAASFESPLKTDAAADIDPSTLGQIASGATAAPTRLQRLPGGGLSGRTPEGRKQLGERFGATPQSEAAVDEALKWLADHQRSNGSWSFNLELDPCNGQCSHGKKGNDDTPTPTTGATGLALLAFLGAGHTHHEGPYQETVRRGLYYLRESASESEFGLDWQQGSMYGHGIALMAVAEALSMTTSKDGKYDTDLKALVQAASSFSCVAQHENGSWGYVPGSPGDTTLTGWQVLSLLATKRNGIYLRSHTLSKAKEFVLSVKEKDEYSFGYKSREGEPTMDAIALTLLLYLGQTPGYTPFDRALDRIADRGPTLTNVYHDYYATLALHHARHRDWDKWNQRIRDHLVATQATSGHERGSWHFKDKWGDVGGRVYTTAMCAMILEVYYRYLPLYDEIEEFPL